MKKQRLRSLEACPRPHRRSEAQLGLEPGQADFVFLALYQLPAGGLLGCSVHLCPGGGPASHCTSILTTSPLAGPSHLRVDGASDYYFLINQCELLSAYVCGHHAGHCGYSHS